MSPEFKTIATILMMAAGVFSWKKNTYAQLGFLNPVLPRDSVYIKNYPESITGRVLFQRKYTGFSIPGKPSDASFRYASNKRFLLGAGFAYKFFNLNISVGLPYLSPDLKDRGKTRSLDLQTYIFGRKWLFDVYGQFYGGFHIDQKAFVPGAESYYFRDDIRLRLIGGTAHYIFNPKKFSFRMALLQDEWQQKSSGTFMLNFAAFYGLAYSNTMQQLIPDTLSGQYGNAAVNRFRFVSLGPGLGYAYNLVIKKHFLLSGSYSANIMASFTREQSVSGYHDAFHFRPGMVFMASAGYHSDNWNVAVAWINNSIYYKGYSSEGNYSMNVGLYRLTVAKRFNNGKVSRKVLRVIDKAGERNILQEIFRPDSTKAVRQ